MKRFKKKNLIMFKCELECVNSETLELPENWKLNETDLRDCDTFIMVSWVPFLWIFYFGSTEEEK